MTLNSFFNARSVVVIGVSRNPKKIGYVIFKNLLNSFKGKIFGVNPHDDKILKQKIYTSVLKIKDKIDLAIIAVPAKIVLDVIKECGKKGIKNVIIISAGFSEIGNIRLANQLSKLLRKYKIRCIGPNTLGIYDAYSGFDCMFIEKRKLERPKQGKISFVTQSGALGAAILDMAAEKNYKFSKFISIGNSLDIDASDILEYLNKDKTTQIICLYIEGLKDGRKFLNVVSKIKKPIIAIKGGVTQEGSKAAQSHTGSLAGSADVYKGIFKQLNIVSVNSLEEMFDTLKLFDKLEVPSGNKVQVITNGGGYGILAADGLSENNLPLATLSNKTISALRKIFPPTVSLSNPMDLLGDADTERYKHALKACVKDSNNDILLVINLAQLPKMKSDIVDVLIETSRYKPTIVISTDKGSLTKRLEKNNIPVFKYPKNAIKAMKNFVNYYIT